MSITCSVLSCCSCALSNLKKVSLELGGKSPLIIFSDCDMDKAVRMVRDRQGLFIHPVWEHTAGKSAWFYTILDQLVNEYIFQLEESSAF